MSKPNYIKQDCNLSLKEGLEEYYLSGPSQIRDYADKYSILINHDITHVIFGLGITIEEESLLDTWTIWGTTITWKEIYQYGLDPEIRKLTKIIVKDNGGWNKVVSAIFKCIPLKFKIRFNRISKMNKKWPFSNITDEMLNRPISDLRIEYGIKIIEFN